MLLNKFSEQELRNSSRETLETLEYWLRQIVDKALGDAYGPNYLTAVDSSGRNIIKRAISEKIIKQYDADQDRFSRVIDASLLDSIIDIICHPSHYTNHFSYIFGEAFPEGNDEARTFFKRLIIPRNRLAHANSITVRQAEQVLCYSHDIIDSIKNYYIKTGQNMSFNVPRFVRFKDSFGNEKHFQQDAAGHPLVNFSQEPPCYLRPGDVLTIEIEVDNTFDESEYTISWQSTKPIPSFGNVKRIALSIEVAHVGETFSVHTVIISNKGWHRMSQGYDDLLLSYYKVLPPL